MDLPKTRDGIVIQREKGDLFLVDTEGGEVFQINETAARIISFCQRGESYEALVASLAEGLDAPGQEALIRADVEETIQAMLQMGICEAPRAAE